MKRCIEKIDDINDDEEEEQDEFDNVFDYMVRDIPKEELLLKLPVKYHDRLPTLALLTKKELVEWYLQEEEKENSE